MLSNIGNQINAEGAKLIGDQGQILDVPGKAISHAAVSALAAEISGGDAKGAAVGALAAELAAITLDETFSDPMAIQAGGKIIGGVAEAIATNSAEGANSGANAGEMVIVYNSLAHLLSAAEKEKSGTLKTYEDKKQTFCQQSPAACQQAGDVISSGTDFVPIVGDIKGFVEAESALDYLAAAIAIIPDAGDAAGKTIKAAEKALQKGDKGYLSQELADDLAQTGVTFITKKRRNMKAYMQSEWDKIMLSKCFIIETINGQLKTISQIEHSRHRSIKGFLLTVLGGLIAYCLKLKKPSLKVFYSEEDFSVTA